MSKIKTTQVTGDVSVGRDVAIGGKAAIQGRLRVGHNLRVEGWLDAKNIKAPGKGVFADTDKLLSAYPNGSVANGSWAIVGGTLPGTLWYVEDGVWVDSGKTAGEVTADVEKYLEDVEQLSGDLAEAKADLSTETEERKNADTTLQGNIDTEVKERKAADAAIEEAYKNADTTLQGSIDTEVKERKAADAAIEEAYKNADESEATARKKADEAIEAAYKDADTALETAYRKADSGLLDKIDALASAGYRLMGVAAPSTNPGTPTENVFYVAVKSGDYVNFDTGQTYLDADGVSHAEVVSLSEGEVALLLRAAHAADGAALATGWQKQTVDLSGAAVKAVRDSLGGTSGGYAPLGDDLKLSEASLPQSVTGEPEARKEADTAIEEAYKKADAALQANIDTLAKSGYRLMGVAVPATNPGAPTENVFYVAREAGDYTHFSRMGTAVGGEKWWSVEAGEIALLTYPGHTGDAGMAWSGGWEKQSISCPTGEITGEQVVAALGYTPLDEAKASSAISAATQAAATATQAAANAQSAIANANKAAQDVEKATAEASRVDADLTNGVLSVTNRKGETTAVNIGDAYEEVEVVATTSVSGVTVEGTTVSLYLNKSASALTQALDASGATTFTIARGTYFEIALPDKAGCKPITPISGTATGGQTTYNVEYAAYDGSEAEQVTVTVRKRKDGAWSAWEGATVHVKVGTADAVDYTTGADGTVALSVGIGQEYTVSMDEDTTGGYYAHLGQYSKTYTAKTTNRVVWMDWYEYRTGVFLVGSDGVERTSEEWDAAGMTETDGVMVKVVTQKLSEGGGAVYMDIDGMAAQGYEGKQWATGAMQSTSIDGIPNTATDKNYYNGAASTDTIIAACEANDCEAPAASYCKTFTKTVGGKTMTGYLPAAGQWVAVWSNRDAVDTLMKKIKGDDVKALSSYTTQKWTSTQGNANYAVAFTSSPGNTYFKYVGYRAVPFYA